MAALVAPSRAGASSIRSRSDACVRPAAIVQRRSQPQSVGQLRKQRLALMTDQPAVNNRGLPTVG